jgi:signal transduction histidine kinase
MVAQLREAEFLEKINDELKERSARLQQTLEALRTAQADLVRAERMASVATLVRGIAHELNNPIGFVAGNMAPLQRYSQFLSRVARELADGHARTPEEIRELTQLTPQKDLAFVAEDLGRLTTDVAEGARRAKLIISDLQTLTSASQRGLESVDVHKVVAQTVTLLSARLSRDVRVETDLTPVPLVVARAGQLEQVVVNLVDNALRAVGDRGTVKVTVGRDGSSVRLSIADDGCGMTANVKRHACEPFFTTRQAGDGSGLGLAIVASIVRAHDGTLDIESETGRGTLVTVRMPIRSESAAEHLNS